MKQFLVRNIAVYSFVLLLARGSFTHAVAADGMEVKLATILPQMKYLGLMLDAKGVGSWIGAVVVTALGAAAFEWMRRRFARDWNRAQEEIAHEIQRREAVA